MNHDCSKSNAEALALARCPECAACGGCTLGIPAVFRIPADHCSSTGLSRTYIYGVTTPSPANDYNPPVAAYEIKKPGAKRGVRLINGASFCQHVRSHQIRPGRPAKKTRRQVTKQSIDPSNPDAKMPASPAPLATPVTPPPPPPPPVEG